LDGVVGMVGLEAGVAEAMPVVRSVRSLRRYVGEADRYPTPRFVSTSVDRAGKPIRQASDYGPWCAAGPSLKGRYGRIGVARCGRFTLYKPTEVGKERSLITARAPAGRGAWRERWANDQGDCRHF
jgi:hypothetical protein